jgi:hypothetical protein
MTLHVPQDLYDAANEQIPDEVNLSKLWQETLQRYLAGSGDCGHRLVECTACGRRGSPGELAT